MDRKTGLNGAGEKNLASTGTPISTPRSPVPYSAAIPNALSRLYTMEIMRM
jgi:hypothetical protein